jgi:hypothetical protein
MTDKNKGKRKREKGKYSFLTPSSFSDRRD